MLRFTLVGLRAYARRYAATALAVVLGVGFVSATLVLRDTQEAAFYDGFARSVRGVDVRVAAAEGDMVAAATLAAVQELSTVEAAAGRMVVSLPMLDATGRAIQSFGRSGVGVSVDGDARLRPFDITGAVPVGAGEALLDVDTAAARHLDVGDHIAVLDAAGTPHDLRLVGLLDAGVDRRLAGLTVVGLPADTLVALTGVTGFDEVVVAARPGVSEVELARAVRDVAGDGVVVQTGTGRWAQLAQEATSVAAQFTTALLLFALVSLVVAAFVIHNTFATMTVARLRQTALLRCVGASRRQIFGGALVEALAVGAVGAVGGVLAGFGLAQGLLALMSGLGNGTGSAPGLVLGPVPVVVGVLLGVAVTVASAMLPAWRATRARPVAALRDDAESAGASRARRALRLALALLVVGTGALVTALGSTVDDSRLGAALVVLGGMVLFLGLLIGAPLYLGRLVAVVGALPARLGGVPWRLAVANARRNPRRTAVTSATLMIGIGLMTVFAVTLDGANATVDRQLNGRYPVDFVMTAIVPARATAPAGPDPTAGIPAGYASALRARPEFGLVAQVRVVDARVGDAPSASLIAVDPGAQASLIEPNLVTGGPLDLRPGTALVSATSPLARSLSAGDTVRVEVGQRSAQLRVVGTVRGSLPAATEPDVVVSWEELTALAGDGDDTTVLARLAPGATAQAGRDALTALAADYPLVRFDSLADLTAQLRDQVDQMMAIFVAMMAIAVVIAIAGVANTLALSVIERRRESATIRALGMTRGQLRRTLLAEAVLMCLAGAMVGIGFGLVYGRLVIVTLLRELEPVATTPWGWIAGFVALAAAAAVLAAVLPARRAARAPLVAQLAQS